MAVLPMFSAGRTMADFVLYKDLTDPFVVRINESSGDLMQFINGQRFYFFTKPAAADCTSRVAVM
jgi:hypothetical protein